MIGHIESESSARTFSAYLYVQGIANQVEVEKDGKWALWVHAEDELENARDLLRKFLASPNDAEYQKAAKEAQEFREREQAVEKSAAKRFFKKRRIFRDDGSYGLGPFTGIIIALCVAVWAISRFGMDSPSLSQFIDALLISSDSSVRTLPEVRQGQVWRIITPIFLHDTRIFLHLLFNMLWLRDLGSMIEARQGWLKLLVMVVVISATSNLAQYFKVGPEFIGMSGVVYGLLGYIWMKGKFDPGSGLELHPSTVTMMLIWFVICLSGFTGPLRIANMVHAVGLGVGVAWGYLSAVGPFAKRL